MPTSYCMLPSNKALDHEMQAMKQIAQVLQNEKCYVYFWIVIYFKCLRAIYQILQIAIIVLMWHIWLNRFGDCGLAANFGHVWFNNQMISFFFLRLQSNWRFTAKCIYVTQSLANLKKENANSCQFVWNIIDIQNLPPNGQ